MELRGLQKRMKNREMKAGEQSEGTLSTKQVPIRCAIAYVIGGGWGKEQPETGTVPTRVIRGTDFNNIKNGLFDVVPLRYESEKAVRKRRLQLGDVILEMSGGQPIKESSDRPIIVSDTVNPR